MASGTHRQKFIFTPALLRFHPTAELCSVCVCVFTVNGKIKGLLKNSVSPLCFDVCSCADAVFGRSTTSYRAGGECYIWTENLVKYLISFKVSLKSRKHHDAAVPPAQCHFVGQCGICQCLWSQQQSRNFKWERACASSCPSFRKDSQMLSRTKQDRTWITLFWTGFFIFFCVHFNGKSVK